MTFDEYAKKQGFPLTSTQRPLWRKCWETSRNEALEEVAVECEKSDGLCYNSVCEIIRRLKWEVK